MSKQRTPKWTGSLRVTPYLIGFIFLTSTTILSLAITSAIQVYKAPIDTSLWSYGLDHRWSLGWHVAYFTTAPLVSTAHSCLDLVLYVFTPAATGLNPIYAVLGATVLSVGWVMQLVFWFQCDLLLTATGYLQCQQFYLLQDDRAGQSMMGKIVDVDGKVTGARVALACLIVVLYLGYFFIAGIAVYRSTAGYRKTEQETNDGLYPAYRQRNTIKTMTAAMFYA